jgi:hypothetical protein
MYGKILWWEINGCLFPLVLLVNVYIFLWNRFAHKKKTYVMGVFVRDTLAALQSLHEGEIFLLKFLTLRFVTDLLVSNHIRRRMERLALGLQNQELVLLISNEDAPRAASLRTESELVERFRSNLASRMKMEIGLLLLLDYRAEENRN